MYEEVYRTEIYKKEIIKYDKKRGYASVQCYDDT